MITKTFTYVGDGYHVDVTVRRATLRDSVVHTVMRRTSRPVPDDDIEDTPKRRAELMADAMISVTSYPDCIAVTSEVVNHPDAAEFVSADPSLLEFSNYPIDLIGLWSEAVYELNPDWRLLEIEDEEKKDGSAARTSPNSSPSE